MENGVVRTAVMLMGLVVLSVLVGGLISDNIAGSIGAFALIAFVVVGFVLLWFAEKSWQLVYFLPAFFFNAPLGSGTSGLTNVPLAQATAAAVLVYGVLMRVMGYIRFQWKTLLVLDLVVAFIFLLFVWSYIQYPVSMQILNPDAEYVGGKEYVWMACSILYYIALSSMSKDREALLPVLKKSFYLFCAGQTLYICYFARFLLSSGVSEEQRYSFVADLSCAILFFLFCSAPLAKLIFSPKKIFIGLCALVGIFFVGRREVLVSVGEALCFVALMKKELIGMLFIGCFAYGSFFILGEQKAWENAPFAVQRVMAVLPGVAVPDSVRSGTEGSSETRRMVWSLGLDSRTGYIKNYIWGDGFQTHMASLRRGQVAAMRKTTDATAWGAARSLANGGAWHNGWLTTVHRLGLVGLVSINILFIVGMVLLLKVSNAYRSYKEYPYLMALCLPFPQTALSYPWGTQTLVHFCIAFQSLGIIKILYCTAREQGSIRPLFFREQYVPMIIRDAEERA